MNVTNEIYPNKDQLAGFSEAPEEGPIFMVNMLKFRETASYQDPAENSISGAEAYERYADAVSDLIQEFGGQIIFSGKVSRLAIGTVDELWDSIAIAQYPSRRAMWDMTTSPGYQAIAHHRSAGLAGQLNIETRAL